jgi:hypothetical protein
VQQDRELLSLASPTSAFDVAELDHSHVLELIREVVDPHVLVVRLDPVPANLDLLRRTEDLSGRAVYAALPHHARQLRNDAGDDIRLPDRCGAVVRDRDDWAVQRRGDASGAMLCLLAAVAVGAAASREAIQSATTTARTVAIAPAICPQAESQSVTLGAASVGLTGSPSPTGERVLRSAVSHVRVTAVSVQARRVLCRADCQGAAPRPILRAYVDETGDRGTSGKSSPFFAFAALLVADEDEPPLRAAVSKLRRDLGVPVGKPLHWKDHVKTFPRRQHVTTRGRPARPRCAPMNSPEHQN